MIERFIRKLIENSCSLRGAGNIEGSHSRGQRKGSAFTFVLI